MACSKTVRRDCCEQREPSRLACSLRLGLALEFLAGPPGCLSIPLEQIIVGNQDRRDGAEGRAALRSASRAEIETYYTEEASFPTVIGDIHIHELFRDLFGVLG